MSTAHSTSRALSGAAGRGFSWNWNWDWSWTGIRSWSQNWGWNWNGIRSWNWSLTWDHIRSWNWNWNWFGPQLFLLSFAHIFFMIMSEFNRRRIRWSALAFLCLALYFVFPFALVLAKFSFPFIFATLSGACLSPVPRRPAVERKQERRLATLCSLPAFRLFWSALLCPCSLTKYPLLFHSNITYSVRFSHSYRRLPWNMKCAKSQ